MLEPLFTNLIQTLRGDFGSRLYCTEFGLCSLPLNDLWLRLNGVGQGERGGAVTI